MSKGRATWNTLCLKPLGTGFAVRKTMFFALKTHVTLRVEINDQVKVIPLATTSPLLRSSSKVVAQSVASVLRYHLKTAVPQDKEEFARSYLEQQGWRIETNPA